MFGHELGSGYRLTIIVTRLTASHHARLPQMPRPRFRRPTGFVSCPLILLVPLSVGVCSIFGCARTDAPTESTSTSTAWARHELPAFELSLDLPATWTLSAAEDIAMVTSRPPEPDDFVIVIMRGFGSMEAMSQMQARLPITQIEYELSGPGHRGLCHIESYGVMRFEARDFATKQAKVFVVALTARDLERARRERIERVLASIEVISDA